MTIGRINIYVGLIALIRASRGPYVGPLWPTQSAERRLRDPLVGMPLGAGAPLRSGPDADDGADVPRRSLSRTFTGDCSEADEISDLVSMLHLGPSPINCVSLLQPISSPNGIVVGTNFAPEEFGNKEILGEA